jgi:cytochrome c biogenesis protein CcdA
VAALALVILIFGAALIVATAQQVAVERLRAPSTAVKRWGGWVLVVVGIWFLVLTIWAGPFSRLFPV